MNDAVTANRRPVVFCDFDGTITLIDTIVALMKHFNPPGALEIMLELAAGTKSLRRGVGELFALLPSNRKAPVSANSSIFAGSGRSNFSSPAAASTSSFTRCLRLFPSSAIISFAIPLPSRTKTSASCGLIRATNNAETTAACASRGSSAAFRGRNSVAS